MPSNPCSFRVVRANQSCSLLHGLRAVCSVFEQSVFERSPRLASAKETSRSTRIWSAARLALVALPWLWAVGYFFPPLNHDVAALLQFAQRMLHGERLYVDLIDINPPMIFLLDTVPVAIAEALR